MSIDKVFEALEDWLEEKINEDEISISDLEYFKKLKQALLEFKSLDLSLRLSSEQSSSHFTYKDKNLVCMQSTKYSKLMNAFLEYEKAQEQEKELVDVEKVKSGKTIIHIGKDLVMMNKAKYYEYLELEEEPVSKRILQAKCEEQEKVLEILKPLCEVVETPVKKIRYLKINGVVVYTFKNEEEFELLKRWSGK